MSVHLSMRGVCKAYQAGLRGCSATVSVLRDLDLDVCAGELVGIAAAPRAGKSTLLMCAAGLLRPDRGVVSWFDGTSDRDASARPHGIAYAGDRPFPYGFLSAREALEYAAIVRDLPLTDSGARVACALDRTGLSALSDRRVDSLDGGALARLALAGALLAHPQLLLIDDLTPGCDARTASELAALLRALAADGTAVVVAGSLVASLASLAATPSAVRGGVRLRPLVLRGGRLEDTVEAPAATVRRAVAAPARARVAELRPGSSLENEAR